MKAKGIKVICFLMIFVAPAMALLNAYFVFRMLSPFLKNDLFLAAMLFAGFAAIFYVSFLGIKSGMLLRADPNYGAKKAKSYFELIIVLCIIADIVILKWTLYGPLDKAILFKSWEMSVYPLGYALISHNYLNSL